MAQTAVEQPFTNEEDSPLRRESTVRLKKELARREEKKSSSQTLDESGSNPHGSQSSNGSIVDLSSNHDKSSHNSSNTDLSTSPKGSPSKGGKSNTSVSSALKHPLAWLKGLAHKVTDTTEKLASTATLVATDIVATAQQQATDTTANVTATALDTVTLAQRQAAGVLTQVDAKLAKLQSSVGEAFNKIATKASSSHGLTEQQLGNLVGNLALQAKQKATDTGLSIEKATRAVVLEQVVTSTMTRSTAQEPAPETTTDTHRLKTIFEKTVTNEIKKTLAKDIQVNPDHVAVLTSAMIEKYGTHDNTHATYTEKSIKAMFWETVLNILHGIKQLFEVALDVGTDVAVGVLENATGVPIGSLNDHDKASGGQSNDGANQPIAAALSTLTVLAPALVEAAKAVTSSANALAEATTHAADTGEKDAQDTANTLVTTAVTAAHSNATLLANAGLNAADTIASSVNDTATKVTTSITTYAQLASALTTSMGKEISAQTAAKLFEAHQKSSTGLTVIANLSAQYTFNFSDGTLAEGVGTLGNGANGYHIDAFHNGEL